MTAPPKPLENLEDSAAPGAAWPLWCKTHFQRGGRQSAAGLSSRRAGAIGPQDLHRGLRGCRRFGRQSSCLG